MLKHGFVSIHGLFRIIMSYTEGQLVERDIYKHDCCSKHRKALTMADDRESPFTIIVIIGHMEWRKQVNQQTV